MANNTENNMDIPQRKKGGQPGNHNATTHGFYSRALGGRRREFRQAARQRGTIPASPTAVAETDDSKAPERTVSKAIESFSDSFPRSSWSNE